MLSEGSGSGIIKVALGIGLAVFLLVCIQQQVLLATKNFVGGFDFLFFFIYFLMLACASRAKGMRLCDKTIEQPGRDWRPDSKKIVSRLPQWVLTLALVMVLLQSGIRHITLSEPRVASP